MDHVLVVVVRYFGGIKLGAGGLARAYGGAAARCLQRAARLELRHRTRLRIHVPFDEVGGIHACLDRHGAARLEEVWTEVGLDLEVEVDTDTVPALEDALAGVTHGRARPEAVPGGPHDG